MPSPTAAPDSHRAYAWYLTSSSLWMAGMSLQGFLFTWMLVGILERPADEVGLARSVAEFPPLLILFIGGLLGDRYDGRRLLAVMHVAVALPPLLLAVISGFDLLNYAWVTGFGVLMSALQALSDPARQAALSRVTRLDTQRAVTIMVICTTLVGLAGFYLGGRLDTLGLATVLVIQALLFVVGLGPTLRLPPLAAPLTASARRVSFSQGVRSTWRTPMVRDLIGLNLLSSLFNAGAYIVVIPFIVRAVYQGDAALFATVMMVFTIGSIGSNVALLAFMPLVRPGRLFLILQLTRIVVLGILLAEPPLWLLLTAMFLWGLNMGITSTLVRTTVQELAEPDCRAQVLSILLVSFMVAAPVSATLLGLLVDRTGPLTGLLPGIAISLIIFAFGRLRSGLWSYRSLAPHPVPV